ncbi:MAG: beta-class carbonic anhydrase [Roseiflexaceae bacterium]
MAVFDEMLAANEQYANTFDRGDLPMPPGRKVAVLTCMDARLHPEKFLGLDVGDAHVIRNAGGRASQDALRSLVISERLLGTTEIVVIHHTDCGMLTFTNADLAAKIHTDLGADASGWDFLPFSDLEESVRVDVQTLRESPFIPREIPISGAIYDVRSGQVQEVVRSEGTREAGKA